MSVEHPRDDALFLSQFETIELVIRYVCRSHHLSVGEAEDFGSYARIRLIENDYGILRKFKGRSRFKSFVSVVIERLLLDFRTHAWGRWRPSAVATRLGDTAVLFEQLTVRDGHQHDEAREILRTRYGIHASAAELDRIAGLVAGRVRRRFESDAALDELPAPDRAIDDVASDAARQAVANRVSDVLSTMIDALSERDALILALRFVDGCTVGRIAQIIGENEKRLFRQIDKLLRQLRIEFEKAGIDSASVTDMFTNPAVAIEWSRRPALRPDASRRSGEGASE